MDLQFLAEADAVTLRFEKAKRALETAKGDLDAAKKNYDEMLSRADEMGVPKAKLKKITEDRIQSLLDNGLLELGESRTVVPKAKKPKVKAAPATVEEVAAAESEFEKDEEQAPQNAEV